jgi:DNA invertase Pin-like site-specific DNA recombinase
MEAVLIYSPDRLSRKYAYQVLLMEEFARHGVEILFIHSPAATTPEEQLLVQLQGMIAEYERAQIAERTRRGKRHRAQSGLVNVLCGAPYGYRYVKKSETSTAFYEVIEEQASVVRQVYRLYTEEGLSIGAIVRWLNIQGIPTRRGTPFGNEPPSGRCCVIRPTRGWRALAKRKRPRDKKSRAFCADAADFPPARAPSKNAPERSGLRSLFLPS